MGIPPRLCIQMTGKNPQAEETRAFFIKVVTVALDTFGHSTPRESSSALRSGA